jgi:mannosyl-oligosaccharide alpha-1,2-mannosidase
MLLAGGLFAMGAKSLPNENLSRHMDIAEGITNTCHESYVRSNTKLGPESFRFTDAIEAKVCATF